MAKNEEIKEKERRIRRLLEEKGLDGILLNKTHNFAWFTCGGRNYVFTGTQEGVSSILITRDKKYLISNNIESGRMVEEEIEKEYFDEIKVFSWYQDKEEIIQNFTKGLKLGSDGSLPGTENLTREIDFLRYPLTPEEVEKYKTLGKLSAELVEKVTTEVKIGDKESEISANVAKCLLSHQILPVVLLVASDERIEKFRHPLPTDKEVKRYAMVVVCAKKWGLIVALTRLVHFGEIPEELREKHDAVVRIDTVFIANTIPGRKVKDILQEGIEAYKREGFGEEWKLHHQGGPTGYLPRDYIANLIEERTIQPNQAVAWNPSITRTKSEDTIIATEKGPEIISATESWPKIDVEYNGKRWERPDILVK